MTDSESDEEYLRSFTAKDTYVPPPIKWSRKPYIPCSETFSMVPVKSFVERWITAAPSKDPVIVDPFARNSIYGTHTNDLNPNTSAQHHMDARDYLDMLIEQHVVADVVILDPPYSPHQIVEMYQGFGMKAGMKEVQIGRLFKDCKNKLSQLLRKDGIALTFGWTSAGFSRWRGFEVHEIMLVYHGAGRNDTICVAERKSTDTHPVWKTGDYDEAGASWSAL